MQVKFWSWNFGAVGSGLARPKVQDPSVYSSKTKLYAGKFLVLGVWRGWEQLILVYILLRTKTQDQKFL